MSKQWVVARDRMCQTSGFNAAVKYLDLLQWRFELESVLKLTQVTSSSVWKGGRGRLSAAMFGNMKKWHFYQTPKNGRGHNSFITAAALLYPRCVCLESWSQDKMSISAWSPVKKAVNFGGVFFGFSLHHLFMHLNHFCHRSALHCLERSKGWFWGFRGGLAPMWWVVDRGKGWWAVYWLCSRTGNCTILSWVRCDQTSVLLRTSFSLTKFNDAFCFNLPDDSGAP